jgi:predicted ATPase
LGATLFYLGECSAARTHVEHSLALYDPQASDNHVFLTGQDPRASGRAHLALLLWILGYPDQAQEHSRQALLLAQNALFPYSQALALNFAAILQLCCRDAQGVKHSAEASQSFARKCGFGYLLVMGMMLQGRALVMQGKHKEGIALMEAGLEKQRVLGVGIGWVHYRTLLAEAYAEIGHTEAGLEALAEAFTMVEKTRERIYEAELYRLKGELTLAQSRVPRLPSRVVNTLHPTP